MGDRAEAELDGVNGLEDDDLGEIKLSTRSSVLGHVVVLYCKCIKKLDSLITVISNGEMVYFFSTEMSFGKLIPRRRLRCDSF